VHIHNQGSCSNRALRAVYSISDDPVKSSAAVHLALLRMPFEVLIKSALLVANYAVLCGFMRFLAANTLSSSLSIPTDV
jgi:hypothetical protein